MKSINSNWHFQREEKIPLLITLQSKIHRDFWHLKNGSHKVVGMMRKWASKQATENIKVSQKLC